MQNNSGTEQAGIYIHIPFCTGKCTYCSFYSVAGDGRMGPYMDALAAEAEARMPMWQGRRFGSIYIGGGTPSALPPGSIPRILETLRSRYDIAPDCEITCEANPETFTAQLAREWAAAGVNRLSTGLQSADEDILETLGRRHNVDDFIQAVRTAHAAGIDNVNGDLMFGVPGQDEGILGQAVLTLMGAGVTHISCYGLQLEPGTVLHTEVEAGRLALPNDDATANMFDYVNTCVPQLGYARYEISNYALPGWECRHNLNYWANGEYLALGASASSARRSGGLHTLLMRRYTNPADIGEYIAQMQAGELTPEKVSPIVEDMFVAIMLATRTVRGLDLAAFEQRYGTDFQKKYAKIIKRCISDGLAQIKDGFFRLTPRGLDIQNSVLVLFLD